MTWNAAEIQQKANNIPQQTDKHRYYSPINVKTAT